MNTLHVDIGGRSGGNGKRKEVVQQKMKWFNRKKAVHT
jgi:hypothetical protein